MNFVRAKCRPVQSSFKLVYFALLKENHFNSKFGEVFFVVSSKTQTVRIWGGNESENLLK